MSAMDKPMVGVKPIYIMLKGISPDDYDDVASLAAKGLMHKRKSRRLPAPPKVDYSRKPAKLTTPDKFPCLVVECYNCGYRLTGDEKGIPVTDKEIDDILCVCCNYSCASAVIEEQSSDQMKWYRYNNLYTWHHLDTGTRVSDLSPTWGRHRLIKHGGDKTTKDIREYGDMLYDTDLGESY
jgi:hypothetical protein